MWAVDNCWAALAVVIGPSFVAQGLGRDSNGSENKNARQGMTTEWMAHDNGRFSERSYRQNLDMMQNPHFAHVYSADILSELIWELAEGQRTCTNGGWEAWVCPFGCHTVPFGPPEESKND
jgi:hypothetical protein